MERRWRGVSVVEGIFDMGDLGRRLVEMIDVR